jgi:hippurate hydrolase
MRELIHQMVPELVALRHELHQHPEIRFEESWTSDRIARFLTDAAIPFTRGHAKGTGIVAEVGTGDGPVVALRADMDALEIQEATGLPYASRLPERMHACGHDGHMAILCGAAKVLAQRAPRGRVKLIFQPAEEQAAGGRHMVEEGVLDDVQAVFALHTWPDLPLGHVAVGPGPMMASADVFEITVTGAGCHAADPGAGIDPVVVAAHVVVALQSIVSREIHPWEPAVVTVAGIKGGQASNVVPDSAHLLGTFRALDASVRAHLRSAIARIATHTAAAHRARAEVAFAHDWYPPVINDPAMAEFARATAQDVLGADSVIVPAPPTMAAEDFAFYLERVPGAFLFLGNHDGARQLRLHSPAFNFNDRALPVGVELMAALALRFIEQH